LTAGKFRNGLPHVPTKKRETTERGAI